MNFQDISRNTRDILVKFAHSKRSNISASTRKYVITVVIKNLHKRSNAFASYCKSLNDVTIKQQSGNAVSNDCIPFSVSLNEK